MAISISYNALFLIFGIQKIIISCLILYPFFKFYFKSKKIILTTLVQIIVIINFIIELIAFGKINNNITQIIAFFLFIEWLIVLFYGIVGLIKYMKNILSKGVYIFVLVFFSVLELCIYKIFVDCNLFFPQ